jgi:hypothetical protein
MTITLTREEAQQVLDAMIPYQQKVIATTKEYGVTVSVNNEIETAIKLLRAQLSAPEPTLVLWNVKSNRLASPSDDRAQVFAIRKLEWQGLTDEEIKDILDCGRPNLVNIKKAEQKLKEKNG